MVYGKRVLVLEGEAHLFLGAKGAREEGLVSF